MIKTPLSTMVGGAGIWTPGCTVLGGQQNINQLIKSLFADGTQGLYLNAQDAVSVSDLSSIKDLSGRNNHAAQPNATSRATLITDPSGYKSLKFDGIDDGYVTPSIDFTGTDKVTVIACVTKLADSTQIIAELSVSTSTNTGAFYLVSGNDFGGNGYVSLSRGTLSARVGQSARNFTYPAPDTAVLSVKHNIPANLSSMRRNGIVGIDGTDGKGTGNFGNYPLYIGRRGGTSLPFNGQIYALLVIGKLLDDATTAKIEKEFAKYIGVTL